MQKSLVIFPERAIISFAKYRKNIMFLQGALAQLGARNIRIVEAVGSNPICSTHEKSRRSGDSAWESRVCGFFFMIFIRRN